MQSISLQLWTIRDALTADPQRALQRVKSIGYSAVELAPIPPELSANQLSDLLHANDLSVASMHVPLPTRQSLAEIEELVSLFDCRRIIWHGWPRDPRYDDWDGIRQLAAEYNFAAMLAHNHGFEFGLHNHWWEFEPLHRIQPYRFLDEQLSPDIFWQLDVYWVRTAGIDPIVVCEELNHRLRSLHLKDGPAIHDQPMTELGEGVVDIRRILNGLRKPVDWVVEIDSCQGEPLDVAAASLRFLQQIT